MKLLSSMQLTPVQSPSARSASTMNVSNGSAVEPSSPRLSFFNHTADFIWRYAPLTFSPVHPTSPQHFNSYPPLDFKNHLPSNLACDPRLWNKEDALDFLRWCELEFDLPRFDMDLFQMNGKALCILTKQDLGERCPGAGDLLYNVLRALIRESPPSLLPQSPLTPHFPLPSPWCMTSLMDYPPPMPPHPSTVTLSPVPSLDSQSGSPKHAEAQSANSAFSAVNGQAYRNGLGIVTTSSGSNQSDSDADDSGETSSPLPLAISSSTNCNNSPPPFSPRIVSKSPAVSSNSQIFFPPNDNGEPNTNGRLLWDFLQQLLNDPMQRYTKYIAWRNQESGVFKIVDPPGLAKLWGIQKNHLSMNYDKMSRALRYYYRVNILRKVQGERHCYQFLRNPTELKSIKNISLLRHQANNNNNSNNNNNNNNAAHHFVSVKSEPLEEVEDNNRPTDLSMSSANRRNDAVYFQFPQNLSRANIKMEASERVAYSPYPPASPRQLAADKSTFDKLNQ